MKSKFAKINIQVTHIPHCGNKKEFPISATDGTRNANQVSRNYTGGGQSYTGSDLGPGSEKR